MTLTGEDSREFTIYNYLGMGLDAKFCKHFHDLREKYPQLFFSQFSNKIIYSQIGTLDLFGPNPKGPHFSKLFDMEIDGKLISITDMENLIVLNIDHWGGGVSELWKGG